MKVLVTGVNGQLGYDCVKELQYRNFCDVIGIDICDLDITKQKDVEIFIHNLRPDIIIHCAAFTAVDRAETEKNLAYSVNALGTKYIAEAAEKIGAKLVYISTDYVFPGLGNKFYEVDDKTEPTNYYGLTKLTGEIMAKLCKRTFIIRISWVFGINGNNFVKTMIKIAKSADTISVVSDQIGSPTYTFDLSKLICDMIVTDKYGTYHVTNEGVCSWHEFAEEIFRLTHNKVLLIPITTDEYLRNSKTIARRPLNSRLSKESLDANGFARLPHWKDALKRFIDALQLKDML